MSTDPSEILLFKINKTDRRENSLYGNEHQTRGALAPQLKSDLYKIPFTVGKRAQIWRVICSEIEIIPII